MVDVFRSSFRNRSYAFFSKMILLGRIVLCFATIALAIGLYR